MKRQTITLFLLALLAFSSAQADDLYASVSYGQVRLDNDVLDDSAEYDNIGFTIGGTRDGGGLGFELFYTLTADRDTVESGGVKVGDIGTSAKKILPNHFIKYLIKSTCQLNIVTNS